MPLMTFFIFDGFCIIKNILWVRLILHIGRVFSCREKSDLNLGTWKRLRLALKSCEHPEIF